MSLPASVAEILPDDTAIAWERIVSVAPGSAYLAGGTALAVHLGHRISRDLDFFLQSPVDLTALRDQLDELGPLHVQAFEPEPGRQTLNAVFSATRIQFLEASSLVLIEPLTHIAGAQVAGIGDLLAMKLKVLLDRPELRDYFDLLAIERDTHRFAEEGLARAGHKYRPAAADDFVIRILWALSSFGDVEEDPGLPMSKRDVTAYWTRRVPEITGNLQRSN